MLCNLFQSTGSAHSTNGCRQRTTWRRRRFPSPNRSTKENPGNDLQLEPVQTFVSRKRSNHLSKSPSDGDLRWKQYSIQSEWHRWQKICPSLRTFKEKKGTRQQELILLLECFNVMDDQKPLDQIPFPSRVFPLWKSPSAIPSARPSLMLSDETFPVWTETPVDVWHSLSNHGDALLMWHESPWKTLPPPDPPRNVFDTAEKLCRHLRITDRCRIEECEGEEEQRHGKKLIITRDFHRFGSDQLCPFVIQWVIDFLVSGWTNQRRTFHSMSSRSIDWGSFFNAELWNRWSFQHFSRGKNRRKRKIRNDRWTFLTNVGEERFSSPKKDKLEDSQIIFQWVTSDWWSLFSIDDHWEENLHYPQILSAHCSRKSFLIQRDLVQWKKIRSMLDWNPLTRVRRNGSMSNSFSSMVKERREFFTAGRFSSLNSICFRPIQSLKDQFQDEHSFLSFLLHRHPIEFKTNFLIRYFFHFCPRTITWTVKRVTISSKFDSLLEWISVLHWWTRSKSNEEKQSFSIFVRKTDKFHSYWMNIDYKEEIEKKNNSDQSNISSLSWRHLCPTLHPSKHLMNVSVRRCSHQKQMKRHGYSHPIRVRGAVSLWCCRISTWKCAVHQREKEKIEWNSSWRIVVL